MSQHDVFVNADGDVGGIADEPKSKSATYMANAAKKLAEERRSRHDMLKDPDNRRAITRATERLNRLVHPDRYHVVIRSDFIYRSRARRYPPPTDQTEEDISTRPPLTRLLHGKNPHALALYLNGLFVHQMMAAHENSGAPPPEPVRRQNVYNSPIDNAPSWTALTGMGKDSVHRRNQRRTLARALNALSRWDLVGLPGDTGQPYVNFQFKCEDGTGHDYTIPRGDPVAPQHLCLPREFFTAGWHLVLTPEELTTFLVVCHAADRYLERDGSTTFFLAESERYRRFGLVDEAYIAIHELAEFGLIKVEDPMPNRRRGRLQPGDAPPIPYNISVPLFSGKSSHDLLFTLDAIRGPAIEKMSFLLRFPLPRYL